MSYKSYFVVLFVIVVNILFFGIVTKSPATPSQVQPITVSVLDSIYSESVPTASSTATAASSSTPSNVKPRLKIPILMYHSISNFSTISLKDPNPTLAHGLKIPPNVLKEQLSLIKTKGYTTITLSQLIDHMFYNVPIPAKPIILTFDDGWADNYTAFSILKEFNQVGDFAIITNLLNNADRLTKDQVREMSNSSMGISSHTLNHPNLTQLTGTQLNNELLQSKQMLETLIDKKVESIVYPTGAYNKTVIDSSIKSGYKIGLTTKPFVDSFDAKLPFEITRVRVQCTIDQNIRDNQCPNNGGTFFSNLAKE
jgi:peptidoglycan/xylan/chitin deacetylase (PgdA/CDA1 family)